VELNIGFLAAGTFAVGLILGVFKERSGSVWPPVTAHVLFDIVVYGEYGSAPWWVWL
jgi:membrane protease YdiL (CAAX protease family)